MLLWEGVENDRKGRYGDAENGIQGSFVDNKFAFNRRCNENNGDGTETDTLSGQ